MIYINDREYYTPSEACKMLDMHYSSVIFLFQKYNIKKYKNRYIITKEEIEIIKKRKKQNLKPFKFNAKRDQSE